MIPETLEKPLFISPIAYRHLLNEVGCDPSVLAFAFEKFPLTLRPCLLAREV